MQRLIALAFSAVMMSAVLTACDKSSNTGKPATKQEAPRAAAEKPTPAGAQHAATDVKPGSHDDWCGEHAVPESQCTRCSADLIPAFKATGDWCEEHGVPESQCLKCNPDLKIVRPPKAD